MSSPSEYATGQEATAVTDEGGDEEPNVTSPEADAADLRRQTADMLRTLADKYETEAQDSRARAVELRAESDAADAKAVQLGDESARIKAEAERLGTEPTWIARPADSSTEAGKADSGDATDSSASAPESADDTAASTTASSGPEPARGFAPQSESETGAQASTIQPGSATTTSTGATGQAESPASRSQVEGDDWAPRPFESWRNQPGQTPPK